VYGFNAAANLSYSLSDDFEVVGNWEVNTIKVYAYQTGSTTASTFTGAALRIYNGNPASGGQSFGVIW
jgi:hypothetical protein